MKIISGKSIFASLVFVLIMSFIVNNLFYNNSSLDSDIKSKNRSKKQEKIIGVEIKQQNQKGDKVLIIADTLEETGSKDNKVILENSITTINQKGILTKIFAGKAILTDGYNNFSFSKKVKIKKKSKKFILKTETLTGTFEKGNYHTDDVIEIVSGNTVIKGKGLNVKKNGEYIKIKGKAILKMLLSKKNVY